MKAYYISAVIPDTTSGGRFAMYRHFIEREGIKVQVASANLADGSTLSFFRIKVARFLERLRRTRFVRVANNIGYLWNWYVLPKDLLAEVVAFQPDIIFTVADNWHCGLAWQVSRRLKIPLVVNFQDLFPVSRFLHLFEKPYPGIQKWLIEKFQYLNTQADLVFYTSEGMLEWFGGHKNGHVLYPLGHDYKLDQLRSNMRTSSPRKIVYAGNCYGAYGRMLLHLSYALKDTRDLQLQIFAAGNDWSLDVIKELEAAGIYQGFQPFSELKRYFEDADAFLTVMSFEKEEETFVRTSFTTKWLDYAPYGKPVCVWAPTYSSVAKFATKYNCGPLITDASPASVSRVMATLFQEDGQWSNYALASRAIAEDVLNPDRLHSILVCQLNALKNTES